MLAFRHWIFLDSDKTVSCAALVVVNKVKIDVDVEMDVTCKW